MAAGDFRHEAVLHEEMARMAAFGALRAAVTPIESQSPISAKGFGMTLGKFWLSVRARHRCRDKASITSSARASSAGGTSRPSAFAILRLMTSSYLVGACTGRQVGRLLTF